MDDLSLNSSKRGCRLTGWSSDPWTGQGFVSTAGHSGDHLTPLRRPLVQGVRQVGPPPGFGCGERIGAERDLGRMFERVIGTTGCVPRAGRRGFVTLTSDNRDSSAV